MSLGSEPNGSLQRYASKQRDKILNLVSYGGFEVEATALFHKLEGVRAAAFLLGDEETAEFIKGSLEELERLDGVQRLGVC